MEMRAGFREFVRISVLTMLAFLAGLLLLAPMAANAANRTKTIHVVYDDSGSMAFNGGDSWSQAKYALEVFSAMLGPNDTLVIYPMTSFSYIGNSDEKSATWGQTITISGDEPASARVDQVSRMNGADGLYMNTPIDSVRKAGSDLEQSNCDDRWLVILTDGIFDYGKDEPHVPVDDAEQMILSYAGKDDISCAYVAIGGSAHPMDAYSDVEGFYPYTAGDGEILDTVTEVARNVYNLQKVSISGGSVKSFLPDIPMSKIVVFSQGNSTDTGILSVNGSQIGVSPDAVHVGIAKDDPVRPQNEGYNSTVADGLNGIVQTYGAGSGTPFPAGEYGFSTDASTTEVYFEPGVDVVTSLSDSGDSGSQEIILGGDRCDAVDGAWTIHTRLMNPLTSEYLDASSSPMLQGAVLHSFITDSSGNTVSCSDGDQVELDAGTYTVFSKAEFRGNVDKISPETVLEVADADISVAFLKPDGYCFGVTSLYSDDAMLFTVKDSSGELLTDEAYGSISFPEVIGPGGADWGKVTPEDEKGLYSIHPSYDAETVNGTSHSGEVGQPGEVTVQVSVPYGNVFRTGTASVPVRFAVDIGATAILEYENGDSYTLDDNVPDMESGDYRLSLLFGDGEQQLPDKDVPFAWALQKKLVLTDGNGTEKQYVEGDTVSLVTGTYKGHTAVSCIGMEENLGKEFRLSVGPGHLSFVFGREDGYTLRMTDLSADEDISFRLVSPGGTPLTTEEGKDVAFEVAAGPEGIDWSRIRLDDSGTFHISPEFTDPETGCVNLSGRDEPLELKAYLSSNGLEKNGSGSTAIHWAAGEVPVELDLVCPEPSFGSGKQKYMFDARNRGVEKDSPFVLVRASVIGADGRPRPMSETEWENAEIAYSSKPYGQGLVWKAISFISAQSLDFQVVRGDEVSTYKMYLSGFTAAGVRPNESLLDVTIESRLDNGIVEKGDGSAVVSVRPVGIFVYIGRLLVVVSIALLVFLFVFMEAKKKRFDRNMYPNVMPVLTKEGVPITVPGAPFVSKRPVRYRIWPPMRAEERDVTFKCAQIMTPIRFTCKALGGGAFTIKDLDRFNVVKKDVKFDGLPLEKMNEGANRLNMDSTINIRIEKGARRGQVIMSFRKSKK